MITLLNFQRSSSLIGYSLYGNRSSFKLSFDIKVAKLTRCGCCLGEIRGVVILIATQTLDFLIHYLNRDFNPLIATTKRQYWCKSNDCMYADYTWLLCKLLLQHAILRLPVWCEFHFNLSPLIPMIYKVFRVINFLYSSPFYLNHWSFWLNTSLSYWVYIFFIVVASILLLFALISGLTSL